MRPSERVRSRLTLSSESVAPYPQSFAIPGIRESVSREKRPAEELAAQPWAGCVLQTRVAVPGLPVNFARG